MMWNDYEASQETVSHYLKTVEAIVIGDLKLQNELQQKREQMEKFKITYEEFLSKQADIDNANQIGQILLDISTDGSIANVITQQTMKYQSLLSTAKELMKKTQQYYIEHLQFNDTYNDCLEWITSFKDKLSCCSGVLASMEELHSKIILIKELQPVLDQEASQLSIFLSLGEKIIPYTNTEGQQKIKDNMNQVKYEFENLRTLMTEVKTSLENNLTQLEEIQTQYQHLKIWLTQVATKVDLEPALKKDLGEKKAQLDKYRNLIKDLKSHQSVCDSIKIKVEQFGASPITTAVLESVDEYNILLTQVQSVVECLEYIVKDHEEYRDIYSDAINWLNAQKKELKLYSDLSGDTETILNQQQQLKVLVDHLPEGEDKLAEARSMSEKVIINTTSQGQEIIYQQIAQLNKEWATLKTNINKIETSLSLYVKRWSEYEQEYETAIKCVETYSQALPKNIPEQCDYSTITELVAKQQDLLNEIQNQKPVISSVSEKSEALLQISPDSKISAQSNQIVANYSTLIETVSEVLLKLKKQVKDHKTFNEACSECETWLHQTREEFESIKPIVGDRQAIQSKIKKAKRIDDMMDSGLQKINVAKELGEYLMKKVPSNVQKNTHDLIMKFEIDWQTLNNDLTDTKKNLESCLLCWNSYEEKLDSFEKWLEGTQAVLKDEPEAKSEMIEKKTQLDKYKQIQTDIVSNRSSLDELETIARELAKLSKEGEVLDIIPKITTQYKNNEMRIQEIIGRLASSFQAHQQYQEVLQEIEKWLLQTSFQFISQSAINTATLEATEEQLKKHHDLMKEIENYQIIVEELENKGIHLMSISKNIPGTITQVEKQLEHVQESYSSLIATAQNISLRLEDILQKFKNYQTVLNDCEFFLNGLHIMLEKEKVINTSSLEDAQKQLGEIQQLIENLNSHKHAILNASQYCEDFGVDITNETVKSIVNQQAVLVKQRLFTINIKIEGKLTMLHLQISEWEKLQRMKTEFRKWLVTEEDLIKEEASRPAKLHADIAELAISQIKNILQEVKNKESFLKEIQELFSYLTSDQLNVVDSEISELQTFWTNLIAEIELVLHEKEAQRALCDEYQENLTSVQSLLENCNKGAELLDIDDGTDIKERLSKIKKLNTELEEKKTSLEDLKSKGAEVSAGVSGLDKDVVEDHIRTVERKLSEVRQRTIRRKNSIELLLNSYESFLTEVELCQKWIHNKKEELSNDELTGYLAKDAEIELQDLQIIAKDTENRRLLLQSIQTQSEGIIRNLGRKDRDYIDGLLQNVETEFVWLSKLIDNKKIQLEQKVKERREFEESFEQVLLWLQNRERDVVRFETAFLQSGDIEKQEQKCKILFTEVKAYESYISNINCQGNELAKTCNDENAQELSNKLNGTQKRYDKLKQQLQEKRKQLKSRAAKHHKFEQDLLKCQQWIKEAEITASSDLRLNAGTDILKELLKKYQNLQTSVDLHSTLLTDLNSQSMNIIEQLTEADKITLDQQLRSLSDQHSRLVNVIIARIHLLEKALHENAEFEKRLAGNRKTLQTLQTDMKNLLQPIGWQVGDAEQILRKAQELQDSIVHFHSSLEELDEFKSELKSTSQTMTEELGQLSSLYQQLVGQVKQQIIKLRQSLTLRTQFLTILTEVSTFITQNESQLSEIDQSSDLTEEKLNKYKMLISNIQLKESSLTMLSDKGQQIGLEGSTIDRNAVTDQIQNLKAKLSILRKTLEKKKAECENTVAEQHKLEQKVDEILEWLQEKESVVKNLPLLTKDVGAVKKELDNHMILSTEVTNYLLNITKLQEQINQESNQESLPETIHQKMSEVFALQTNILSELQDRDTYLTSALETRHQYNKIAGKVSTWLETSSVQFLPDSDGVDFENINSNLEEYQTFFAEENICFDDMNLISIMVEKIIPTLDDIEKITLTDEIKHMQEDVNNLINQVTKQKDILHKAKREWVDFIEMRVQILNYLQISEDVYYKTENQNNLVAIRESLQKTEYFTKDLQKRQNSVADLNAKARTLDRQGNADSRALITRWMSDINNRWADLNMHNERRQSVLKDTVHNWEAFHFVLQELNTILCDLELKVTNVTPSISARKDLTKYVEKIKALEVELALHKSKIVTAKSNAEKLINLLTNSSTDVHNNIREEVHVMEERYIKLEEELKEKQQSLEQELTNRKSFHLEVQDLLTSLESYEKELQHLDVCDVDEDVAAKKYQMLKEKILLLIQKVQTITDQQQVMYTEKHLVVPKEIADKLKQLKQLEKLIMKEINNKGKKLQHVKKLREDYQKGVESLSIWLQMSHNKLEEKTNEPQQAKELLMEMETELKEYKSKVAEVQTKSEVIVKETSSTAEENTIRKMVVTLTEQYAALQVELAEHWALITHVLESWNHFHSTLSFISEWLNRGEQLTKTEYEWSSLSEAKHILKQYQTVLNDSSQVHIKMDELNLDIEKVSKVCDVEELIAKASSIKERITAVESSLIENVAALQETSVEWEQADKQVQDITRWLEQLRIDISRSKQLTPKQYETMQEDIETYRDKIQSLLFSQQTLNTMGAQILIIKLEELQNTLRKIETEMINKREIETIAIKQEYQKEIEHLTLMIAQAQQRLLDSPSESIGVKITVKQLEERDALNEMIKSYQTRIKDLKQILLLHSPESVITERKSDSDITFFSSQSDIALQKENSQFSDIIEQFTFPSQIISTIHEHSGLHGEVTIDKQRVMQGDTFISHFESFPQVTFDVSSFPSQVEQSQQSLNSLQQEFVSQLDFATNKQINNDQQMFFSPIQIQMGDKTNTVAITNIESKQNIISSVETRVQRTIVKRFIKKKIIVNGVEIEDENPDSNVIIEEISSEPYQIVDEASPTFTNLTEYYNLESTQNQPQPIMYSSEIIHFPEKLLEHHIHLADEQSTITKQLGNENSTTKYMTHHFSGETVHTSKISCISTTMEPNILSDKPSDELTENFSGNQSEIVFVVTEGNYNTGIVIGTGVAVEPPLSFPDYNQEHEKSFATVFKQDVSFKKKDKQTIEAETVKDASKTTFVNDKQEKTKEKKSFSSSASIFSPKASKFTIEAEVVNDVSETVLTRSKQEKPKEKKTKVICEKMQTVKDQTDSSAIILSPKDCKPTTETEVIDCVSKIVLTDIKQEKTKEKKSKVICEGTQTVKEDKSRSSISILTPKDSKSAIETEVENNISKPVLTDGKQEKPKEKKAKAICEITQTVKEDKLSSSTSLFSPKDSKLPIETEVVDVVSETVLTDSKQEKSKVICEVVQTVKEDKSRSSTPISAPKDRKPSIETEVVDVIFESILTGSKQEKPKEKKSKVICEITQTVKEDKSKSSAPILTPKDSKSAIETEVENSISKPALTDSKQEKRKEKKEKVICEKTQTVKEDKLNSSTSLLSPKDSKPTVETEIVDVVSETVLTDTKREKPKEKKSKVICEVVQTVKEDESKSSVPILTPKDSKPAIETEVENGISKPALIDSKQEKPKEKKAKVICEITQIVKEDKRSSSTSIPSPKDSKPTIESEVVGDVSETDLTDSKQEKPKEKKSKVICEIGQTVKEYHSDSFIFSKDNKITVESDVLESVSKPVFTNSKQERQKEKKLKNIFEISKAVKKDQPDSYAIIVSPKDSKPVIKLEVVDAVSKIVFTDSEQEIPEEKETKVIYEITQTVKEDTLNSSVAIVTSKDNKSTTEAEVVDGVSKSILIDSKKIKEKKSRVVGGDITQTVKEDKSSFSATIVSPSDNKPNIEVDMMSTVPETIFINNKQKNVEESKSVVEVDKIDGMYKTIQTDEKQENTKSEKPTLLSEITKAVGENKSDLSFLLSSKEKFQKRKKKERVPKDIESSKIISEKKESSDKVVVHFTTTIPSEVIEIVKPEEESQEKEFCETFRVTNIHEQPSQAISITETVAGEFPNDISSSHTTEIVLKSENFEKIQSPTALEALIITETVTGEIPSNVKHDIKTEEKIDKFHQVESSAKERITVSTVCINQAISSATMNFQNAKCIKNVNDDRNESLLVSTSGNSLLPQTSKQKIEVKQLEIAPKSEQASISSCKIATEKIVTQLSSPKYSSKEEQIFEELPQEQSKEKSKSYKTKKSKKEKKDYSSATEFEKIFPEKLSTAVNIHSKEITEKITLCPGFFETDAPEKEIVDKHFFKIIEKSIQDITEDECFQDTVTEKKRTSNKINDKKSKVPLETFVCTEQFTSQSTSSFVDITEQKLEDISINLTAQQDLSKPELFYKSSSSINNTEDDMDILSLKVIDNQEKATVISAEIKTEMPKMLYSDTQKIKEKKKKSSKSRKGEKIKIDIQKSSPEQITDVESKSIISEVNKHSTTQFQTPAGIEDNHYSTDDELEIVEKTMKYSTTDETPVQTLFKPSAFQIPAFCDHLEIPSYADVTAGRASPHPSPHPSPCASPVPFEHLLEEFSSKELSQDDTESPSLEVDEKHIYSQTTLKINTPEITSKVDFGFQPIKVDYRYSKINIEQPQLLSPKPTQSSFFSVTSQEGFLETPTYADVASGRISPSFRSPATSPVHFARSASPIPRPLSPQSPGPHAFKPTASFLSRECFFDEEKKNEQEKKKLCENVDSNDDFSVHSISSLSPNSIQNIIIDSIDSSVKTSKKAKKKKNKSKKLDSSENKFLEENILITISNLPVPPSETPSSEDSEKMFFINSQTVKPDLDSKYEQKIELLSTEITPDIQTEYKQTSKKINYNTQSIIDMPLKADLLSKFKVVTEKRPGTEELYVVLCEDKNSESLSNLSEVEEKILKTEISNIDDVNKYKEIDDLQEDNQICDIFKKKNSISEKISDIIDPKRRQSDFEIESSSLVVEAISQLSPDEHENTPTKKLSENKDMEIHYTYKEYLGFPVQPLEVNIAGKENQVECKNIVKDQSEILKPINSKETSVEKHIKITEKTESEIAAEYAKKKKKKSRKTKRSEEERKSITPEKERILSDTDSGIKSEIISLDCASDEEIESLTNKILFINEEKDNSSPKFNWSSLNLEIPSYADVASGRISPRLDSQHSPNRSLSPVTKDIITKLKSEEKHLPVIIDLRHGEEFEIKSIKIEEKILMPICEKKVEDIIKDGIKTYIEQTTPKNLNEIKQNEMKQEILFNITESALEVESDNEEIYSLTSDSVEIVCGLKDEKTKKRKKKIKKEKHIKDSFKEDMKIEFDEYDINHENNIHEERFRHISDENLDNNEKERQQKLQKCTKFRYSGPEEGHPYEISEDIASHGKTIENLIPKESFNITVSQNIAVLSREHEKRIDKAKDKIDKHSEILSTVSVDDNDQVMDKVKIEVIKKLSEKRTDQESEKLYFDSDDHFYRSKEKDYDKEELEIDDNLSCDRSEKENIIKISDEKSFEKFVKHETQIKFEDKSRNDLEEFFNTNDHLDYETENKKTEERCSNGKNITEDSHLESGKNLKKFKKVKKPSDKESTSDLYERKNLAKDKPCYTDNDEDEKLLFNEELKILEHSEDDVENGFEFKGDKKKVKVKKIRKEAKKRKPIIGFWNEEESIKPTESVDDIASEQIRSDESVSDVDSETKFDITQIAVKIEEHFQEADENVIKLRKKKKVRKPVFGLWENKEDSGKTEAELAMEKTRESVKDNIGKTRIELPEEDVKELIKVKIEMSEVESPPDDGKLLVKDKIIENKPNVEEIEKGEEALELKSQNELQNKENAKGTSVKSSKSKSLLGTFFSIFSSGKKDETSQLSEVKSTPEETQISEAVVGSVLEMMRPALSSTWSQTTIQLKDEDITDSIKRQENYQHILKNVRRHLKDIQVKLDNEMDSNGNVKKQMEKYSILIQEIDSMAPDIRSVQIAGQEMEGKIKSDDQENVHSTVAELWNSWDTVRAIAYGKLATLESQVKEIEAHERSLDVFKSQEEELETWLLQFKTKVAEWKFEPQDEKAIKTSILQLETLQLDLSNRLQQLQDLFIQCECLSEKEGLESAEQMRKTLILLQEEIAGLRTDSLQTHQQLQENLEKLKTKKHQKEPESLFDLAEELAETMKDIETYNEQTEMPKLRGFPVPFKIEESFSKTGIWPEESSVQQVTFPKEIEKEASKDVSIAVEIVDITEDVSSYWDVLIKQAADRHLQTQQLVQSPPPEEYQSLALLPTNSLSVQTIFLPTGNVSEETLQIIRTQITHTIIIITKYWEQLQITEVKKHYFIFLEFQKQYQQSISQIIQWLDLLQIMAISLENEADIDEFLRKYLTTIIMKHKLMTVQFVFVNVLKIIHVLLQFV